MSTELFRKYIDIVEGREQVNEGMIDDIKAKFSAIWTKLKAMPGFAEAYQKAKTMEPQLKQILQSSSSGKEAAAKIKSLVAGDAVATTNEESTAQSDFKYGKILFTSGTGVLLVEQLTGLLDRVIDIGQQGNWGIAGYLVGVPIAYALCGLFAMMIAKGEERRNLNAIQRQQDLSKQ